MSGLLPFRDIPKTLVEWTRWCVDQEESIRDTVSVTGDATIVNSNNRTVTFAVAQADTDYAVLVDSAINETFWVTGKTVTGFVLNSSNSTSTASVVWVLIRR